MAKIVWGFPGVGKSAISDGKSIIDADYNLFKWNNVSLEQLHGPAGSYTINPDFPQNYIDYVKSSDADIVLINCNISLLENFKDVTLVYPDISLKGEYLERYRKRGDNNSFLSFMNDEFEGMINIIEHSFFRKYKITEKNMFLKDILQRKDLKFMFMTKKEMVELLSKGVELQNSENYKKTGCDILENFQFDKMYDLNEVAQQIFEGERSIDFDKLKEDFVNVDSYIENALAEIRKEQLSAERRAGLSREELADKIMQGIVNGALGIRYAEISPYSHGYEVTFGGSGPVGSTRGFSNRWACYCDFFEIGNIIVSKIEKQHQDGEVFGKSCEDFHIEEMLQAIERREAEKIKTYTPEKDTYFQRAKNSYTYPYRSSIATVMDVHAGKGLDGIVQHHYHGDWSSMTPNLQNSLVERLVYLNGFCLDYLDQFCRAEKQNIVNYLKKHGIDISTPEKMAEWTLNNPEKCGREINRENLKFTVYFLSKEPGVENAGGSTRDKAVFDNWENARKYIDGEETSDCFGNSVKLSDVAIVTHADNHKGQIVWEEDVCAIAQTFGLTITEYGSNLINAFKEKCGKDLLEEARLEGMDVLWDCSLESLEDHAALQLMIYGAGAILEAEKSRYYCDDNDLLGILQKCIEPSKDKSINSPINSRETTDLHDKINCAKSRTAKSGKKQNTKNNLEIEK